VVCGLSLAIHTGHATTRGHAQHADNEWQRINASSISHASNNVICYSSGGIDWFDFFCNVPEYGVGKGSKRL